MKETLAICGSGLVGVTRANTAEYAKELPRIQAEQAGWIVRLRGLSPLLTILTSQTAPIKISAALEEVASPRPLHSVKKVKRS